MTDHEMRVKLCEAMGWTDIQTSRVSGQVTGIDADGNSGTIPNPLESDRDAALLRAWCVGQGWCLRACHDEGAAWWEVSDLSSCRGPRGDCMVRASEEPDPLRRERLALCRAVLQILDTVEAGGEA